LLFVVKEMV